MIRRIIYILVTFAMIFPAMAQVNENLDLIGRWGYGPCNTTFAKGDYVYMGNGVYLDIYYVGDLEDGTRTARYTFPDVVHDIFVDRSTAYVAVKDMGLYRLDVSNPGYPDLTGSTATNGSALRVNYSDGYVFVAEGQAGLSILNASSLASVGQFDPDDDVTDVHVSNGTAFLAGGSLGLLSVDVSTPSAPVALDTLDTPGDAVSVFVRDDYAYVADWMHGIWEVDITAPATLGGNSVLVRPNLVDVFVDIWGTKAYVADAGYGLRTLDLNTGVEGDSLELDGTSIGIYINGVYGYVANLEAGMDVVRFPQNQAPEIVKTFPSGENAYDVLIDGQYVFVAGGESGLWVLSRPDYEWDDIAVVAHVDTLQDCRGLARHNGHLFVADGNNGLKIYDVTDMPALQPRASVGVSDAAYDVDVDGDSAYVADGTSGLHVFDISTITAPISLGNIGFVGGTAYGVRVDGTRDFVYVAAEDGGLQVVDLTTMTVSDFYINDSDAFAVEYASEGDQGIYVADGTNGLLLLDVPDEGGGITLDEHLNTAGTTYDVALRNGTAFIADGEGTVRMIDLSGGIVEVGRYHTADVSYGVDTDETLIAVADGEAGVYFLEANYVGYLESVEDSLAFGEVVVNNGRSTWLHLVNTGSSPVTVTDIFSDSGRFYANDDDFTVSPGNVSWVRMTFNPNTVQTYRENLYIVSSAVNDTLIVPVSGTGIERVAQGAYTPDYFTYALYHLDTKDNNIAEDDSWYGYFDGFANDPSLDIDEGRFNGSYFFGGYSDYISVPLDSLDALPDGEGFTVDLWFKLNTEPEGIGYLFNLQEGTDIIYQLTVDDVSSTHRGLIGRSGSTILSSGGESFDLTVGRWYHAALTHGDNNLLKLYLNGILVDSQEIAAVQPTNTSTLTIGNSAIGAEDGFPGWMDEIRVSGVERGGWEFPRTYADFYTTRSSFNFGNIRVGNTSTAILTITNYGYYTLNINSMDWNFPHFSVSDTGFSVPSNTSESVNVSFTPQTVGIFQDTLLIYTDDPDEPVVTIPMYGAGVQGAVISTATERLDFGRILIGNTSNRTITLTNTGDANLEITNIYSTLSAFNIPVSSDTLVPSESLNMNITFDPALEGVYQDTLRIVSNSSINNPLLVPMIGTAVDYRDRVPYEVDAFTIALYHFDGTSETTVFDATGFHNGTMHGDLTRMDEGFYGKAMYFEGTDGYVSVPDHDDLNFDPQTDDFTIECFFRTDTVSHALLFKDYYGGTAKANYGLYVDAEGFLSAYGFDTGETRVNDNAWHHVALVYDASSSMGSLYLDGVQEFQAEWHTGDTDATGQGVLVMGAREYSEGDFRGFYQGYLDEVRISNVAREPWEFVFATTGIYVILPETIEAGTSLQAQITVPYHPETASVNFYYKQGGATAYNAVAAVETDSITYIAAIVAADVTIRGLEYYVMMNMVTDTLYHPQYDPVNNPLSAHVHFENAQAPVIEEWLYTIASVPADLNRPYAYDVLNDDLGDYHPLDWRCFAWKDTGYVEFSDTLDTADATRFMFQQGQAVWLITQDQVQYDIGEGYSVSLDEAYRFNLRPQWSMIGSPYPFPVAWDDCSLASDSIGTLYHYDGTGYRLDWPYFDPWGGYWIYNSMFTHVGFTVPPRETVAANGVTKRAVTYGLEEGEWIIRFSADAEHARDLDNYIGVRSDASDTWDLRDRMEPPPIGDYIALYFEHYDWATHAGAYAADVRAPGSQGYVWDFIMESRLAGETISLSWEFKRSLPAGWQAYLIDVQDGVSIDLTASASLSFKSAAESPNVRRYQIIVGPPEFVQGETDVPLQPVAFHLFQNYPNPFNPETTISYSIPKNGHVRLVIYNIMGQIVRTLVDEEKKTGQYEAVWNATNESGIRVPSGMYFYRLEFPDRMARRKLILLK